MEIVQVSFRCPKSTRQQLKVIAAQSGTTIQDLFEKFAKELLESGKAAA